MNRRELIGAGDKIIPVTLPVIVIGLILNFVFPGFFSVGGPPEWLRVVSILALVVGVVLWMWSVFLIVTQAAKGRLITTGPFALVKHPIYTFVSLLVLPSLGFLLDSWLGVVVGIVMYLASRKFAPSEEVKLAGTFGPAWDDYVASVKMPWL